jgi:ribosomal protein L34E
MPSRSLSIVKWRLVISLVLAIFGIFFLLENYAWATGNKVETKKLFAIQCRAEYFKAYESLAKLELATFPLDGIYRGRLVEFVSLLNRYKKNSREYCGYSSNHYLALLWKATYTLKKIRHERGPFPPDTSGPLSESRLNGMWTNGFKFGWNGFPKNPKQLSCLRRRSGVLETLDECEKLNPDFFRTIRLKKLPKGWEKLE